MKLGVFFSWKLPKRSEDFLQGKSWGVLVATCNGVLKNVWGDQTAWHHSTMGPHRVAFLRLQTPAPWSWEVFGLYPRHAVGMGA